jgi:nucleotide-binding universal stress UspA family protein
MIPCIEKILYVSDIQDGSRPAFRMAVSLAKQYAADIVFLHVVTPIPDSVKATLRNSLPDNEYEKIQNINANSLKESIQQRIDDFCASELENMHWQPKIQPVIAQGGINSKIIDVAALQNVDMIVMGTRTHSASKEFFMGSTAHKVIRYSKIPVLVVPLNH